MFTMDFPTSNTIFGLMGPEVLSDPHQQPRGRGALQGLGAGLLRTRVPWANGARWEQSSGAPEISENRGLFKGNHWESYGIIPFYGRKIQISE